MESLRFLPVHDTVGDHDFVNIARFSSAKKLSILTVSVALRRQRGDPPSPRLRRGYKT